MPRPGGGHGGPGGPGRMGGPGGPGGMHGGPRGGMHGGPRGGMHGGFHNPPPPPPPHGRYGHGRGCCGPGCATYVIGIISVIALVVAMIL